MFHRHIHINYEQSFSGMHAIKSGVPQRSVLGSLLYILYTVDILIIIPTDIGSSADNTVIMPRHNDLYIVAGKLQNHLNKTRTWLHKWSVNVTETKNTYVKHTLRKSECSS